MEMFRLVERRGFAGQARGALGSSACVLYISARVRCKCGLVTSSSPLLMLLFRLSCLDIVSSPPHPPNHQLSKVGTRPSLPKRQGMRDKKCLLALGALLLSMETHHRIFFKHCCCSRADFVTA
jgi:hypothetical protein